jgi:hypothetical protein
LGSFERKGSWWNERSQILGRGGIDVAKVTGRVSLVFTISQGATANAPSSSLGNLLAADIVNKNVSARGGLRLARGQTMSMEIRLQDWGHGQSGGLLSPAKGSLRGVVAPRPGRGSSTAVYHANRPGKMRRELPFNSFNGQTAIQVYDDTNG